MKKLIFMLCLFVMACSQQPEKISEAEVVKTLEGFFDAFDVENTNPDLLDEYITKDFLIYEAAKKMNKEEFLEFVGGFPITKSEWELSDFKISTDVNSAHISLFNKGDFIMQYDTITINQKFEWLESAYLVKEEGKLKIKFYFSDHISIAVDTIR